MQFLAGVIVGIVISSVPLTSVAHVIDRGVEIVKAVAQEYIK